MDDLFLDNKAQIKSEKSPTARPKSAVDKDPIDLMLEKKKNFQAELKPKSKPDQNFISGLQSQITKEKHKVTEINHRCNTLEQKLKASDEKLRNMTDSNKTLKDENDKLQKEVKNVHARIHYLTKEKQDFEDQVKELKHYVTKLEQRILQNPAQTKNATRAQSPQKELPQRNSPAKEAPNKQSPHKGSPFKKLDKDFQEEANDEIERLRQTVENQRYEIKLLTQALEEKERIREIASRIPEAPVKEEGQESESSNNENPGNMSFEPKRKEYESLMTDFQYLLKELTDTKASLNQLREENIKKEQELRKKDQDINNSIKDKDLMRLRKEEAESEKNSLHDHIRALNERIRLLTDENMKMSKELNEVKLKVADDKNKLYLEINARELELKSLRESLLNERDKSNDLTDKLNDEVTKQLELIQEKENLRAVGNVNALLKGEVDQLKTLLKEYEKEVQFYRDQTLNLQKDKDNLRAGLENFIHKSNTLVRNENSLLNDSVDRTMKSASAEEIERLEIERKKLKDALNQARNEIDAYKQKELEIDQVLQKKEKQINNLVNSRNMMQNTLAEQVFSQKKKIEEYREENVENSRELTRLREENQSLREILRKQEKFITEQQNLSRKPKLTK